MAETRTTRMSLPQWSVDTDSPSRDDFNEAFSNIETKAAIDEQGTRIARPAPGVRGRFYTVNDPSDALLHGAVYRDNGTAWVIVGSAVEGLKTTAPSASTVPLYVRGAASQTANLMEVRSSADVVTSRISPDGSFVGANVHIRGGSNASAMEPYGNSAISILSRGTDEPTVTLRGVNGQTAALMRIQNGAGNDILYMTGSGGSRMVGELHTGSLAGPFAQFFAGGVNAGHTVGVMRGAPSQTANLFEAQNSGATILSRIDAAGRFYAKSGEFQSTSNTEVPLTVKQFGSSSTSNVQVWTSDTGTVLAYVDRYGNVLSKNIKSGTTAQRDAYNTTGLATGSFWWDTTTSLLNIWNGSTWQAIATTWENIGGKPSTFPPSEHIHDYASSGGNYGHGYVNRFDNNNNHALWYNNTTGQLIWRVDNTNFPVAKESHSHAAQYIPTQSGNVQADLNYLSANKANTNGTIHRANGSDRPHVYGPEGSGFYAVWVDGNHNFCRNTSSVRYKENIRPSTIDEKAVLELEPVIYDRISGAKDEFGMIAEEVHKHIPQIVTWHAEDGEDPQIDGIRYDLLAVAMLPLLKRHEAEIAALKAELESLRQA